jgi:peptidyl-prolyl cis-trans isomerase D
MLQSMRHLAQSWVFKGLMLILIISFGIWGIGDIFRGNPLSGTVAKAGRVTITVQDLDREFEQTMIRARQMFGPDLTAQQAKQIGLLDTALNALIERAQVDQDIKRLGINVSDRAVLDRLTALPQFRNKDGSLNKDQLRMALAQAHLSERQFLNQERMDLARHQLIDIFTNEKPLPPTVVDDVYRARGQKRILDVVTLKNDSIGDIASPDDKALHAFYDQNPKLFTAPEHRAITIARLATDDVAKDIAVSDEDVRKEYEAKRAEMSRPERRDLLQTVMQDEAKAKRLAAAAKVSGNLAAAAKSMGYQAVPLNQTEAKTLLPELVKPVFAMQTGAVSDPVKSNLGWHVVQVKKISPAGTPTFEDVKDQLRADMKRDQAIDSATRMVNKLDDELAAGHALDDIADSMKMRLIKIPALEENGKTPDGKDPPELPHKDDVLKAAFSQNVGETSPVMDDKNGNYFVVRTDDVVPSAVKPFDQVKDAIAADWKMQEQAKEAAAQAEKIAKGLQGGAAASSFAAQKGVDVRVSKPISLLGESDPGLPESLIPQILQMKKGEVITSPLPGKQVILRLAEIVNVDASADKDAKGKIAEELSTGMPKELAEEYLRHLRFAFPIEIRRDTLETVSRQGG